jgi:hypothetical protein
MAADPGRTGRTDRLAATWDGMQWTPLDANRMSVWVNLAADRNAIAYNQLELPRGTRPAQLR